MKKISAKHKVGIDESLLAEEEEGVVVVVVVLLLPEEFAE